MGISGATLGGIDFTLGRGGTEPGTGFSIENQVRGTSPLNGGPEREGIRGGVQGSDGLRRPIPPSHPPPMKTLWKRDWAQSLAPSIAP